MNVSTRSRLREVPESSQALSAKSYVRHSLIVGLAAVLTLGLGVAVAQEQVRFYVEAPSGNVDGYGIFGVTFLKNDTIVGEINVPLISSSGFSSVSVTISTNDVPDEVEVDFAVPFNGAQTLYSVAGPDFAFDVPYFLPSPSPGGVITPPSSGGATDAFFQLSLMTVEPPDDQNNPTCEITETSPGVLEAVLQDEQSGLDEIAVRRARNLTVVVPSFERGTTMPVTVDATVDDPRRFSVLVLKAVDVAGNRRLCAKLVWRSHR